MSRRKYTSRFVRAQDKVNVYWKGRFVMGVLHVSNDYEVAQRSDEEVAATVLQDVKREADSIVEDYLVGA